MKSLLKLLPLLVLLTSCITPPPAKTVSVTVGALGYNDDRINIIVEKKAPDMTEAEKNCDKVFYSILELLENRGLTENDYNLSENSTYKNPEDKSDSEKYIARKAVDIRVTDDMDPDKLMNEFRNSGATGVYRNVYDRSAKQKAPSDLESLLVVAEQRALKIAETAGYSLGDIIRINEMDYGIEDGKIYNIEYQLK